MRTVWTVFGSVIFDRLSLVEATISEVKDRGVDWRLPDGKNVISLD